MSIPTDYALMAQMAITLAGFTGIVGNSRREAGRTVTSRERMHLGLIVQTASFVVFLGFLPSALTLLPITEEIVWRTSISIMAVAHITTWIGVAYHSNFGRKFFSDLKGMEQFVGLSSVPFGLSAVVGECLMAFGLYPTYIPFLYQAVLMLFISVGLWSFLSLLLRDN
jgi:hypothetical protein